MPRFNIVVFAGDYAGPEVTAEAVKVSAVSKDTRKIHAFGVPAKSITKARVHCQQSRMSCYYFGI